MTHVAAAQRLAGMLEWLCGRRPRSFKTKAMVTTGQQGVGDGQGHGDGEGELEEGGGTVGRLAGR